jgi:hypothetical protein
MVHEVHRARESSRDSLGQPFNLAQVKQIFIAEFLLPQSEQHALSELREIK